MEGIYQDAIPRLEKLDIGKVEFVSAGNIEVILHSEAPQNLSLNTGSPLSFPLINNCLLIPNEKGYLVGMVSKLRVSKERINPESYQHKKENFLGMPFSKRIVSLAPLGVLTQQENKEYKQGTYYSMDRGTISFPAIGDSVHIPTRKQLEAILGATEEEDKRLCIGTLAHDSSIDVSVDPNKIFGRHLAVLGNTGSGKSCTIAGLVHWSIKAAEKKAKKRIQAKFIILDINGEYAEAFKNLGDKVLILNADNSSTQQPIQSEQLKVPCHNFTEQEWGAFLRASPGIQYPFLVEKLRSLWGVKKLKPFTSRELSEKLKKGNTMNGKKLNTQQKSMILPMISRMYDLFNNEQVKKIVDREEETNYGMYDLFNNEQRKKIVDREKETNYGIENIKQCNKNIVIIDLSTLSDDILHLITSVIARMFFEEHKKKKGERKSILILDEAHRFIGDTRQKSEETESLNTICTRCFSRIAREGRKFGLNIIIASQMPHDVSPKVLSQCNTFMLHRIVSKIDQEYVKRLLPDSLGEIMDELPSLPSRYAFLLGYASSMPKLIKINELPEDERPSSADPKIWEYWIGKS